MSDQALEADAPVEPGAPELLAAVRAHRAEFEDAGLRAEELRTLPPDTVATLRDLGLFWLKTPAELGGTPLDPLEFCDVIEELAFIDTATAWAAMIGNGCTGMASGWLPDAGVRRLFVPGRPLPVVAGQPQPRGTARPVDGGYRVSGRYSFSSGIVHANWVIGGFPAPDDPSQIMCFVAPKDDAEVIDTWHVAGLQGTGSLDYQLSDVFVPAEMTYLRGGAPARGGALFRLEGHLFVDNEVPPLAVGLARRAIIDMAGLAGQTARFPGGSTLSERAVFHKELGRAHIRVRAARAVHREAMEQAWAAVLSGNGVPEDLHVDVAAASVYAVETCADVVADLFRYGGGRALSLASPLQRHLRDALAARQHVSVSEEIYEAAGRDLLRSVEAR
jgi:alkylation response protein AidB-like acyl-CoA dehydrogenase